MKIFTLILLMVCMLSLSCASRERPAPLREMAIYDKNELVVYMKENGNILAFLGERELAFKTTTIDSNTGITTIDEKRIVLSKNTMSSIFSAGIGFVTALFVSKP